MFLNIVQRSIPDKSIDKTFIVHELENSPHCLLVLAVSFPHIILRVIFI